MLYEYYIEPVLSFETVKQKLKAEPDGHVFGAEDDGRGVRIELEGFDEGFSPFIRLVQSKQGDFNDDERLPASGGWAYFTASDPGMLELEKFFPWVERVLDVRVVGECGERW